MKTTNALNRLTGCLLVILVLSTAVVQAQEQKQIAQTENVQTEKLQIDLFQFVLKSDNNGLSAAITNGGDVNRATNVGNTALMSAAKIGDYLVIKTLLDNEAEVNMQNQAGATALMIAAKYGHPHVISEFLKHKADPTIKTKRGYTAANFASAYKHPEVYELLKDAEKKFIALR